MRGSGTQVEYTEVSWSTLNKLLPYLMRYHKRLLLALALLVLAKVASTTLPFILKHIVDSLNSGSVVATTLAVPLGLLLAYGGARLANVLFSELRDTVFGRVTEHAMHDIALRVFKHLHALDLRFHLDRKTGGLARDIERGTTGISFLLRFMVFNIVPTCLEIILVIVLLSSNYSPWYGVIVFAAIVTYTAWSIFATERRTRFVRAMNSADSATNTRAVDSLLNFETVKYFNNEEYEAKHYDKNLSEWEAARRNNRLSIFALNGGQACVIAVYMTIAMILAAYQIQAGEMSIGDFVLINAFMLQIFVPLSFLGFVYREMKGSMANIEKMFNLLEEKPSVIDQENAKPLNITKIEICFSDVAFSYNPTREIFSKLSFTIKAKNKTAIVGSSGSGKSTISKLLFRFYDPTAGKILIDGQDIKSANIASLRQLMGFVPQDAVLFNASIFENIQYGNVSASEQEVKQAIELAHLDNFIEQLAEGWHTMVGERGLKLSGGEKQRVAIARAILKNPDIMIFDEATSSLDSESEREILSAINSISQQKTSIVIAHRLSTIADADCIIVLEKGEIVEQGRHADLIELGGRYAELWHLQESD